MAEHPTVSVLMAAYNAERHVRPAIESILNQSFRDFEFIIVDDGSTDSTPGILQEYASRDPRVRILTNEKNLGLIRSLNKGIDAAHASLVARMDADDISYPDRVDKQVRYMKAHPEVCMVATSYERIDGNGNLLSTHSLAVGREQLKKMMRAACAVIHGSVMYSREKVIVLGKYREGCLHNEDYDLWLRMIEKEEIDALPDVLYQFRIVPESITFAKSAEMEYYARLVRRFARERKLHGKDSYDAAMKNIAPPPATTARSKMAKYHFERGLLFLSSNRNRQARSEFRSSLRYEHIRPVRWMWLLISILPIPLINVMRNIQRRFRFGIRVSDGGGSDTKE
jgi:glycosyltransferase involved in cell wall biosynthesis